jgi:hypothetical protein
MINVSRIREISWSGVPEPFRGTVWRLLLDYEPINRSLCAEVLGHKRLDYVDCLDRVYGEPHRRLWTPYQREILAQIRRDLPRSQFALVRNQAIQKLFERVLFVWAVRHPACGYVQGMNDVVFPLFFVLLGQHADASHVHDHVADIAWLPDAQARELEADCFWCFSRLMECLQDLYTKEQPGVRKMLTLLEQIVRKNSPELAAWIQKEAINYQEFAFRWMNCLLIRELRLGSVLRLWDCYVSNHRKIATTHVFVCAALAPRLIGLTHSEFVVTIQRLSPGSWTQFIAD